MPPKTSRDIPGSEPQDDDERDRQKAVIEDAEKTDVANRDKVHGDGGEIGIEKD